MSAAARLPSWREEVERIFADVVVRSPEVVEVGGRPLPVAPEALAVRPGRHQGPPIVEALTNEIYTTYYTRTPPAMPGPLPPADDGSLLRRLSEANAGAERWELWWRVTGVAPGGRVRLRRGPDQRSVWAGQYISEDGPGVPVRPGAMVRVFQARESSRVQPGTYFAFGAAPEDADDPLPLTRVYFAPTAESAPALVAELTRRFNRLRLPFRFKCMAIPALFSRADAGVLYVSKRAWHLVREVLRDVLSAPGVRLRPTTPLFTSRLAPGVGVGEDPAQGESFGQVRARALAEAIWECAARAEHGAPARRGAFERRLDALGIDRERPHLNAGNADIYQPLEAAP